MADILEMGVNWLSDQFKAHASREVTLRTPGGDLSVLATLGRTEIEEVSQSGVVVRIKVRDYLVDTDDLVLGASRVIPDENLRVVDGPLICQAIFYLHALDEEIRLIEMQKTEVNAELPKMREQIDRQFRAMMTQGKEAFATELGGMSG